MLARMAEARGKIAALEEMARTLAHLAAIKELGDVVLFDIAEGLAGDSHFDHDVLLSDQEKSEILKSINSAAIRKLQGPAVPLTEIYARLRDPAARKRQMRRDREQRDALRLHPADLAEMELGRVLRAGKLHSRHQPLAAALAGAVNKACHERGLVTLTCGTLGNVFRFLPPLTITDELLDEGLDVFEEAFAASV